MNKLEILAAIVVPYIICLLVIWNLPFSAPKDVVAVPVDVTRNGAIDACVIQGGMFTVEKSDYCRDCNIKIYALTEHEALGYYSTENDRTAVVATCTLPGRTITY